MQVQRLRQTGNLLGANRNSNAGTLKVFANLLIASTQTLGEEGFGNSIKREIILRAGETMPLGSRGGLSVQHYFPLDATYRFKIDPKTIEEGLNAGEVIGFSEPKLIDLRLDGTRVKLFEVGGESKTLASELQIRMPV